MQLIIHFKFSKIPKQQAFKNKQKTKIEIKKIIYNFYNCPNTIPSLS